MTLILVRHAAPEIDPSLPAARWRLSEAGRRSCAALAARLGERGVRHLVSSPERKARETAELVAGHLDVSWSTAEGLGEQRRDGVELFATEAEFRDAVRRALAEPDRLVLGSETARAAGDRFAAAIDAVVAGWSHPGPVAVVAHGTVISLLVERRAGRPAFETWNELGLASLVCLKLGP